MACAAPLAMMQPTQALAQSAEAEQNFAIPADSLNQALQTFSAATGIQLVYASDLVAGLQSPGVNGRMTARAALDRLLAGSGLTGSFSGNTATIRGSVSADGERVTSAVRVQGVQGSLHYGGAGQAAGVNGVNGSRDITATEGTGSFTSGATTVGSKTPQALKDIPHSVSVLTSERMAQQNVTDFESALRQLPGVTLVQNGSNVFTSFISRGFEISSIQIDGGAPLLTASGNNSTTGSQSQSTGLFAQIDLAQYDHVELQRGSAGFNGYGNPSGSVNLVRKKPLDHAQFLVEGQIGSWNNYRVVADATSPIGFDGALRGRLVTVYQDREFFYDTAKDNKTLIYGIAEGDVTPNTLVTVGASYTRQQATPWVSGLPRYRNGDDLKLPRSTCLCFDWNRFNVSTLELFGSVEQKLGEDWTIKLNATRTRQKSEMKAGGNVYPVDPSTDAGALFTGNFDKYGTTQFSSEGTVTGSFMLFGQRQEIIVGASRVSIDSSDRVGYNGLVSGNAANPYVPYPGGPAYYFGSPNGQFPPIDVFNFDPTNPLYTEPRNPLPTIAFNKNKFTQSIAYLNARLTPIERLHLNLTFRGNWIEVAQGFDRLCAGSGFAAYCAGQPIGTRFNTPFDNNYDFKESNFSWPPMGALSYDVTDSVTAYVGYSDIYESQGSYLDRDLRPLDPITGSNIEAGVKWAAKDGRFNVSLSAYRTERRGRGLPDPLNTIRFLRSNLVERSRGIDLEAAGELARGWQISASYSYSENKQSGSDYGTAEGLPFASIQPKHLYKIWTSYNFGAAGAKGMLSRLTLSGGVNGQSFAYRQGNVCRNLIQQDGFTYCNSNGPPDYVPYRFTIPGYMLFAARVDYKLSDQWSMSLNMENITDKTYYQTVAASPNNGHWYGAPRSVTFALRGKF